MKKKHFTGFTIIELVISISILVFVSTGIYAAYRELSIREALDSAHQELKTNLSNARQLALSGVKPEACKGKTLTAFKVIFSVNKYQVYAQCEIEEPYREYVLSELIKLETKPDSITYKVIGDGVLISPISDITIASTADTARTRTIKLNNQGLIE